MPSDSNSNSYPKDRPVQDALPHTPGALSPEVSNQISASNELSSHSEPPVESNHAPTRAIGPNGESLTLETLPSPNTKRWVIRRKAEVVAAVRAGLLSMEQACERYMLSVEEFLSWQGLVEDHGILGLRTTRLQHYRGDKRSAS